MSSVPMALPAIGIPASVDAAAPVSPFNPTTTANIERANRLAAVRTHPGFLDIIRISMEIRDSATKTLVEFGGWDKDQIALLKVRAQAASEHHELLLQKIQQYIQAGIDEAQMMKEEGLTPVGVDQSDYVRRTVLADFERQDAARVPGSY